MRQRGIIFKEFIVLGILFIISNAASAATEYWNSTSADWTTPEKWSDGSVPVAPMASGDYLNFGDKKVNGNCFLTTDAGIFAARLYMNNNNTLHIQHGGSLATKWGRIGNNSAASINISGNGSFQLNDDDIYFGIDGGYGELKMYDTSSLTTISTDSESDTLHFCAYASGSTALFQLNGSNITVDVDELHILSNQWTGTSNMEATLEYVPDTDGVSTIVTGKTYIGEGNGTAHLVITDPSVTLDQVDIVLIENTGAEAIGGVGVFNTVNNASAAEGALVYFCNHIYSLTYQYDATGDGADNDIALLFVGVGTIPHASEPSPALGETVDSDGTVLSWLSAQDVVRNEIYLGTDETAVANAHKLAGDVDGDGNVDLVDLGEMALQWLSTPSDPCPDLDLNGKVDLPDLAKVSSDWQDSADMTFVGSTDASTFDPGHLEPGTNYYWRVDSVYCDGIEPSPVWNFQTKVPAFPGAEGFGKWATGGRGGDVYHVTNLNDSGPGSFRDAVSTSNRTIVFDVSGIINLESRITTMSTDLTIAGQTAPGEGIMIYGDGLSYTKANRTITRYMRYRMGRYGTDGADAVGIANGDTMIFDHCSFTWGRDENFSVNPGTDEDPGFITIQDCIVGQGLVSHSCGGLMVDWEDGLSILRCLYIDNDTRNPKVRGINEFINSVVYNWDDGGYIMAWTDSFDYYSYVNAVNNYFISGPGVSETTPFRYGNSSFHIYHSNNWYDSDEDGVFDGRVLTDADYTWNNETVVTEPFDYPGVETLLSPRTAVKSIASTCGPSFPARDRTDTRLIKELTSYGTLGQFISDENASPMYGVGTIASGICPTDTDQDGMPDYWEESIAGLDMYTADNNGDVNNNSYTNLEDYINWLGTLHADVQKNAYADIDLRIFTSGFNTGATYIVSDSTHGTAVVQADGYTVRYTPETDYLGLAELTFTVNDGDSMTCTVELLVSEYGGHPLPLTYPIIAGSGLKYSYYEGSWNFLPDFDSLTAVDSGTCSTFDIGLNSAEDGFAYDFEGFVDIPVDGQYTFYVTSDDGSRLFIDGGVVVSHDGVHGSTEAQGKVALIAGKHKIRVTYFENSGGQTLQVQWAGPGFTRQLIPNSVLYRGTSYGIPEGLWAQGDNGAVTLDWDDKISGDWYGYNVYRTTMPGSNYVLLNTVPLTVSTYTDTNVTNGVMYYYIVTGVHTSGYESGAASEACAVPVSSGLSCIIQENRFGYCGVDDGGTIDTNHLDYTGDGFINTENLAGEGVDWSVNVPSAGTYTITWRYSGTSNRPGNLLVDSSIVLSGISFPATADWDTWTEVSQTVSLSAGDQTLRLEATGSSGLSNIDYIKIVGQEVQPISCP